MGAFYSYKVELALSFASHTCCGAFAKCHHIFWNMSNVKFTAFSLFLSPPPPPALHQSTRRDVNCVRRHGFVRQMQETKQKGDKRPAFQPMSFSRSLLPHRTRNTLSSHSSQFKFSASHRRTFEHSTRRKLIASDSDFVACCCRLRFISGSCS